MRLVALQMKVLIGEIEKIPRTSGFKRMVGMR